jgi:hypothetical protein
MHSSRCVQKISIITYVSMPPAKSQLRECNDPERLGGIDPRALPGADSPLSGRGWWAERGAALEDPCESG